MEDNTSDRHNSSSNPFNEKHAQIYRDDTPPSPPSRAYIPAANRDPEKAYRSDSSDTLSNLSSSSSSSSSSSRTSDHTSIAREWQSRSELKRKQERIAQTLIHLSSTNPLVSVGFCFYTIFTTVFISIFGVFRSLGKDGISIKDQMVRALAPAIRYQLRLITTDINLYSRGSLSARRLIGILCLSPLFSIGVMLAAWTAGSFWMFTTILGEPNEEQGKEVDGKSAARWVKRFWERWLLLGL